MELAPEVDAHLRQSYGARAGDVTACMLEDPSLAARIVPDLPFVWAEAVHAARTELVTELEDVLRRRIPVYRDAADQGLGVAARATELVGHTLGWSADHRARTLASYLGKVAESRAWRLRAA